MLRSGLVSFSRMVSFALALGWAAAARGQVPVEGLGPDLQIAGGVGVGLGAKLDNAFLGRVRLGALYVFEPYWVDAGATVEIGALAELAVGGEIEWNQWNGVFANAGLHYGTHERLTSHVGAGFMIFGLEWQHAFEKPKPVDALLFTVRFPLGFWWFTRGRDERPFEPPPSPPPSAASAATPQVPRPLGPQPSAAGVPVSATPDPGPRRLAEAARAEAALAEARGDHAATADALRRAHAADPEPRLWLRIADADLARGKRALAAEALQQFLVSASSPEDLASKPSVETRLSELLPQLARLRVSLDADSGGEQVEIDGVLQPGALLGYDVLLDPGSHVFVVRRAGQVVGEHRFDAKPGELVRLALPLPAAETGPER